MNKVFEKFELCEECKAKRRALARFKYFKMSWERPNNEYRGACKFNVDDVADLILAEEMGKTGESNASRDESCAVCK